MRPKTVPISIIFFFSLLNLAQASESDTSQPRMLRASLVQGDVTFQRSDLDKWVDLSINTPILEGDRVWVGRDGRVEFEFEDGSTVRLAENSASEFTTLGSYSNASSIQIRLDRGVGSFRINAQAGPFVVESPVLAVVVRQSASFRVDVESDGSSRLVVFDGKAEVQSQAANVFLSNGETFRLLSSDPERYYLGTDYQQDEWDNWNSARDEYLEKQYQQQRDSGELPWNDGELDAYGTWYDVPTYGQVWRPNCNTDWAPFRAGRWTWYDSFGWTWISYEPWGWLPYHYGRWAFTADFGWCWVPGGVNDLWCPGAVGWVVGPGWVGWCPLAPNEAWYPYSHGAANVFVSGNYRYRNGITYLPRDTFINGSPVASFQPPTDPVRGGGRFIPGQPDFQPTTASRMPVINKMGARKYDNDDLAIRGSQRDQIIQRPADSSSSRGAGAQRAGAMDQPDQRRNQRDQIVNRGPEVQSIGKSSASGSGVQVINGGSDSRQAVTSRGAVRSFDSPESGKEGVRTLQKNELDKYWNRRDPSGSSQNPTGNQPDRVQVTPSNPGNSREDVRQVFRTRSSEGSDRYTSGTDRGPTAPSAVTPSPRTYSPPVRVDTPAVRSDSGRSSNTSPAPSSSGSAPRESSNQTRSDSRSSGGSAQESRSSARSR